MSLKDGFLFWIGKTLAELAFGVVFSLLIIGLVVLISKPWKKD